jgi:hypothetical protein
MTLCSPKFLDIFGIGDLTCRASNTLRCKHNICDNNQIDWTYLFKLLLYGVDNMAETSSLFSPALIVVDMQNDFCPPVCRHELDQPGQG